MYRLTGYHVGQVRTWYLNKERRNVIYTYPMTSRAGLTATSQSCLVHKMLHDGTITPALAGSLLARIYTSYQAAVA